MCPSPRTDFTYCDPLSMGVEVVPMTWLFIVLLETSGAFPGGSDGKGSACNARDLGLIPELGKPPGEGNGSPFQYSCLENPMDRGAWRARVGHN